MWFSEKCDLYERLNSFHLELIEGKFTLPGKRREAIVAGRHFARAYQPLLNVGSAEELLTALEHTRKIVRETLGLPVGMVSADGRPEFVSLAEKLDELTGRYSK